jgi:hypothetical protein
LRPSRDHGVARIARSHPSLDKVVSDRDGRDGKTRARLTGIGNLDADGTALEGLSITGEGSLETLKVGKLGVRKALGTLLLAVLNDAHVHNLAIVEELGDGLDGRIVGQVAEVGGERGLVGQNLGKVVAERVIAWHEER